MINQDKISQTTIVLIYNAAVRGSIAEYTEQHKGNIDIIYIV